ncbi:lipoxygenase [Trichoderma novae-zelandiae]
MSGNHPKWTSELILARPANDSHAEQRKRDLGHIPPSEMDPLIVDSLLTEHATQMAHYRLRVARNELKGHHDLATLRPRFNFYKDNANDEATYEQVQATFAQIYDRVEKTAGFHLCNSGVEQIWPRPLNLREKNSSYQWKIYYNEPTDQIPWYPPHLELIPWKDRNWPTWIFNFFGLAETSLITAGSSTTGMTATLRTFALRLASWGAHGPLGMEVPNILDFIPSSWAKDAISWVLRYTNGDVHDAAMQEPNMEAFETYNREHRKSGTDIAQGENLGLLRDWYSDRRFAEQSFTGANPTTIKRISPKLLNEFRAAAHDQKLAAWEDKLAQDSAFFVQDFGHLRHAIGVDAQKELQYSGAANQCNWACASVTLFQLHNNGRLHPIAIVIDYKESMKDSVTIFNKAYDPREPTATDETIPEERDDWPWRYAKTCAQVSDWMFHEVGVHLTRAHFVEEAVIVATHRTVPENHIVFKLLHPHWYKTLSLNAGARATLVPSVITELVGLEPHELYKLVRYEYNNFDFVNSYVPKDLANRGFSDIVDGLSADRYKNYAYAKDALAVWRCIREYVKAMLQTAYGPDEELADSRVEADGSIKDWCKEVQLYGGIASFPRIETLDELCDAITMTIHLAAPFHSAVNYLQNFYLAFVPAKPPALAKELPQTLEELGGYQEVDLMQALPVGRQRQWMLATQLPWLLSFKPAGSSNLITLAKSQQKVNWGHTKEDREAIAAICKKFEDNLLRLESEFDETSENMDIGRIPYKVMNPEATARSILI